MLRRLLVASAPVALLPLLIPAVCPGQRAEDAAERRRRDISRFEHRATFGGLELGVGYTGRTLIAGKRSVLIRKHLVLEVLLIPAESDGIRLSQSAFLLRINGEKEPRLPQVPGVVAYTVRNPDFSFDPRLTASAGAGDAGVVWDSGPQRRSPRFPGDPRVPRRPPLQRPEDPEPADPLAAEAETVIAHAFPNSVITEPTSGFLYFPADIDLDKVKKLELIFAPDEQSGKQTSIRLR